MEDVEFCTEVIEELLVYEVDFFGIGLCLEDFGDDFVEWDEVDDFSGIDGRCGFLVGELLYSV